MEARNRTLPDWMTRIRTRQLVLPRFQRYESWSHAQVTSLLNTILKELPAGAILTLDVGENEPFLSRPIAGAPNNGEKISEHLLDGQQRLTSIWKSLNNLYEDRIFFIKIEEDHELELPFYATSVGTYYKNKQKYPRWSENPIDLWSRSLIPVSLLRPDPVSENEFKNWAKIASNNDIDKLLSINDIGNKLRNKFSTFNIPFLSLPVTTKPEVALDVFIRMNTSASPLKSFDIVVAQIEAASGISLHGHIDEIKQESPSLSRYGSIEDIILSTAALLQNKIPSKGTYLSPDFSKSFEENWTRLKQGIKKAILFLQEEKIYDSRRLPSDVILYVISALWSKSKEGLDQEGEVRSLIRKYIWRSFFTTRYDRSTTSRAYSDYKELNKIISGQNASPEIFNESIYPIADSDELITANWPYRKDRLARAILSVCLKSGGFDFADGAQATYENIQSREYHHIFPQAWLKERGFKDYEINKALNCALISWKTNRNISAKTPSDYIAERMEKSSLGEDEVLRRLKSHLIPIKEITENDYESFMISRSKSIQKVVNKLCNGEIVESSL